MILDSAVDTNVMIDNRDTRDSIFKAARELFKTSHVVVSNTKANEKDAEANLVDSIRSLFERLHSNVPNADLVADFRRVYTEEFNNLHE